MATVTTVHASQILLRLTALKTSGLSELFTVSNATLLAALPSSAGPLRRLLEATYATAAAAQDALQFGPDVRLEFSGLNGSTTVWGGFVRIDGSNNAELRANIDGSQNIALMLISWEFRHTFIR